MTSDDSTMREYVQKLFGTRDESVPTTDREYVRKLFGNTEPDQDDAPATPSARSNTVPREGSGNGQQRPADYEYREFVGELFGVHPNERNLY